MDIVDTFNHLIPSDQLDDSLLIGQNLECEASNEFGSGLDQLEDSLKNMLSDKDPMFGSASSQFNLLDNDDPNFHIAGAPELEVGASESRLAAAGSELPQAETPQVKRPVGRPRKNSHGGAGRGSAIKSLTPGRPGRKPGSGQQKTFLIQKGATTSQIRRDLHLGGRVDISDLDVGLWLSPVVVLRRLTVTVGGFRIELLPGPSYAEGTNAVCFEDGFSYDGGMEYTMLQDVAVNSQNASAETLSGLGAVQALANSCADDLPLSLGPYVNPNDVQAANGALPDTPCLAETKLNDQSDARKPGPASKRKGCVKKPQPVHNNKVAVNNNTGDKEQRVPAKKQMHLKQGLSSVKNKLLSGRPSGMVKGLKGPQHVPTKGLLRGDIHAIKAMKQKQGLVSLKRRVENLSSHPASKVPRMQDGRPVTLKPKPLVPSRPPLKRTLSSDGGPVGNPGVPKPHSHAGSKPHHPSPGKPSQPSQPGPAQKKTTTSSEDERQEKPKAKKSIIQRQKSRNSRSISVEEPQLFVPDNAPVPPVTPVASIAPVAPVAPVAKVAAAEEPQAHTETVWDGSKSCGLCKKHHNNTSMVGCGRCDDWFHGDCVGLDLQKVQEMEKEDQMYVCLKCCAVEATKVEEPAAQGEAKPEGQSKAEAVAKTDNPSKQAPKQKPGSPHPLTSGGVRPFRKDSVDRRPSTEGKESAQRTGLQVKQESKSKASAASSKRPPSVEEIRRSVRDSLREILLKRLKEADFVVATEKAAELAKKTERELFHFYKDTDSKYKSKYRSLMFNLKDTKNNVLFKRVLKGEISPDHLIRMSPEELASKELAAWRQRENRHTIEMIEKDQREAERRPITKITHKGEIEIESQEPAKAPEEAVEVKEPESDPKALEEPVELPLQLIIEGGNAAKNSKDTTSLHKSHLFDLHCKICTGRMAQPVEEAPTKVVKVATTVVKRQSTDAETKSAASPAAKEDDPISVLEESLLNAKVFSNYKARSDYSSGRDEEAAFLSSLKPLWRGFLNMAAVAKMVTKVYPVSGVLDSLTEDLPDSIQVGGRISPQTVWDYLEKIRATGTKEVCLIRFSPETEEDEISYTLLHAYFSSRKRFGVVANNHKRVKDMYLVPLGGAEKVPHQLVPFDGPGLEANRPNLLLGLIIRQRPKRDFLPVDVNETARFIPESKPPPAPSAELKPPKDEEACYLTSLTVSHRTKDAAEKKHNKDPEDDVAESSVDSPEKASEESEEVSLQESLKPLRFLPGVLRSWGGELPPLPDVWGKPLPGGDGSDVAIPGLGNYPPATPPKKAPPRLDRFVIKKKEPKTVKTEPGPPTANPAEKPPSATTTNALGKDAAANHAVTSVSLKDKPPDVSTEAFLAGLPPAAEGKPTGGAVAPDNKAEPSSENGKPKKEEKCTIPSSGGTTEDGASAAAAAAAALPPKPAPSGILKKSTAYPTSVTDGKRPEGAAAAVVVNSASHPAPSDPQPVPVLNTRSYKGPAAQQGAPKPLLQADYIPLEESGANAQYGGGPDLNLPPPGAPGTYPPNSHGPQGPAYPPIHGRVPEYPYPPPVAMPPYPPYAPPQVPGSYVYPGGPPPPVLPHPDPQTPNHTASWAPPPGVPPGLGPAGFPDPPEAPPPRAAAAAKEDPGPESMLYTDPWDRQPQNQNQTQQADPNRDQHSRRRHHSESSHPGKKSRHHDREHDREKKPGREDKDKDKDKHRDRSSRYHGHSKEDRHGDRRKDRHHGDDDHGGRHKDRHRHRRDSDHDRDRRRGSKDSHS